MAGKYAHKKCQLSPSSRNSAELRHGRQWPRPQPEGEGEAETRKSKTKLPKNDGQFEVFERQINSKTLPIESHCLMPTVDAVRVCACVVSVEPERNNDHSVSGTPVRCHSAARNVRFPAEIQPPPSRKKARSAASVGPHSRREITSDDITWPLRSAQIIAALVRESFVRNAIRRTDARGGRRPKKLNCSAARCRFGSDFFPFIGLGCRRRPRFVPFA